MLYVEHTQVSKVYNITLVAECWK